MQVIVDRLIRDEGTILVFEGKNPATGHRVQFAAEHRPGWALANAIVDRPVVAEVEPYQVLGEVVPRNCGMAEPHEWHRGCDGVEPRWEA